MDTGPSGTLDHHEYLVGSNALLSHLSKLRWFLQECGYTLRWPNCEKYAEIGPGAI